jgi:hypothetical protein
MNHGVYRGLFNGVHLRGDGGVLYVRGDECAYRFANEMTEFAEEFRAGLQTLVDADVGRQMFYVVDHTDGALQVRACSREAARLALVDEDRD